VSNKETCLPTAKVIVLVRKPIAHTVGNIVHIYDTAHDLAGFNEDLLGMIDKSYDAVCIADGDSRILLLNQAFEKVMGLPIKETIGTKIMDLIRDGVTDTAATKKVLETGEQATVAINTNAGRQVLSTGVPTYGPDGRIRRVYCNLRDVTDLIRLREQYSASQKLATRYLLELQKLRSTQAANEQFVTRNQEMRQVIDLCFRMAQVGSNLLFTGESGVGKDELARIVHEASPRAEKGSLVKVNCAAIPENLMESELFGYESGAFTGARSGGKVGYFEIADRGTLFLDEVGDLPLALQSKLLTVLQDRKVIRVGGTKAIPVDCRIIAATNRNLKEMVKEGLFREDLYYRINVVPIKIPPLRQRADDIPFLVAHFLQMHNNRYQLRTRFSEQVIDVLCKYSWPGNVRQLMNLVERMVVTATHNIVDLDQLPSEYTAPSTQPMMEEDEVSPLKEAVQRLEDSFVKRAVSQCSTREEAATALGISLSSLTRRLRRARKRH
jgi:PAS domain S-box-containing protein